MSRSDSDLGRIRPSVVDAHLADHAAPADIQRAYLRFSWARRKAPRRLPGVRWLLAGIAVGVGVASAATLVQTQMTRWRPLTESAKAVASKGKHHSDARAAGSGAVKEEPTLVAPLVASSEGPPAPLAEPPSSGTPGVVEQRSPTVPSAAAAASTITSEWQRAAAALRVGDLPAAEAALAKLEQSEDLRDRQAAELARAQLLVGRGRGEAAVPTLQRLAREGVSPVIRSRAASVLNNLPP
jgi:hypothetical protein